MPFFEQKKSGVVTCHKTHDACVIGDPYVVRVGLFLGFVEIISRKKKNKNQSQIHFLTPVSFLFLCSLSHPPPLPQPPA